MENKSPLKSKRKWIGILSISLPIVIFLLILNWLLKITPYQKLEGMPLLAAPFVGLTGFILSCMSFRKSPDHLAKWSMAINIIVFASPFLYWIAGTLIFGP